MDSNPFCFIFMFIIEFAGSIFAICLSGWLLYGKNDVLSSGNHLAICLIFIGLALLFLCVGSCCYPFQPECGIVKFACCTVPLFIALGGLGIFFLSVSHKGGGRSIPGASYKAYELDSYSEWMQKEFNDTNNKWDEFYRNFVLEQQVCVNFFFEYATDTLDQFHRRNLDPFESGCCKPPEDCNFNYTSPATWIKPEKDANYTNNDCSKWNNDPKILCLDCQSCKAAVLDKINTHWFRTGLFLVYPIGTIFLLVISVTFSLACLYYFKEMRRE